MVPRNSIMALVAYTAIVNGSSNAGEPWGRRVLFPGPNPTASDLLPDADPDRVFLIGQILFEYPVELIEAPAPDVHSKDRKPITDLASLQSVAHVVKTATPDVAFEALVEQQLGEAQQIKFESATVSGNDQAGFDWHLTWVLYPKIGGSTGQPFRYHAMVTGHGEVIAPKLTVFDAHYRFAEKDWLCSMLPLEENKAADAPEPKEGTIRERAAKKLNAFVRESSFQFVDQQLVHIPYKLNRKTRKIEHHDLWAVSYAETKQEKEHGEKDAFTVWVTKDGRVADLRQLDLWGSFGFGKD